MANLTSGHDKPEPHSNGSHSSDNSMSNYRGVRRGFSFGRVIRVGSLAEEWPQGLEPDEQEGGARGIAVRHYPTTMHFALRGLMRPDDGPKRWSGYVHRFLTKVGVVKVLASEQVQIVGEIKDEAARTLDILDGALLHQESVYHLRIPELAAPVRRVDLSMIPWASAHIDTLAFELSQTHSSVALLTEIAAFSEGGGFLPDALVLACSAEYTFYLDHIVSSMARTYELLAGRPPRCME